MKTGDVMPNRKRKKVIIVGAGLGGVSAAISLAQEGYNVEIYEKNDKIGENSTSCRLKGIRSTSDRLF